MYILPPIPNGPSTTLSPNSMHVSRISLVHEDTYWLPRLFRGPHELIWSSQVPPCPSRGAVRGPGWKRMPFSTLALSIDYPRNLRPMSPEHGTCLPQIATAIHLKRVAHKTQGAQGKVCWPAATQHSYLPGRGSEFNNPARPAQSDWHLRHPAWAAIQNPPANSSCTPKTQGAATVATYTFFLAPFLPPFVRRLFLPTAMVLLR